MSELSHLAPLAALISALSHAVMTLLNKQSRDLLVLRSMMFVFSALLLSPVLLTQSVPSVEVFSYLIASAVVMWAFNLFMMAAFARGDMNLVYPVMRGAAPAMTAFVAFLALGEGLRLIAIAGLLVSCLALIAFAWPEQGGRPKLTALGFAIFSAMMTAGYTVIDAAGIRLSGSVLVYLGWQYVFMNFFIGGTALWRRGTADYLAQARKEWRSALICSVLGVTTYATALWAYAHAPVAPMAAIRETSIVFGAILAALVLKEGFGVRRAVLATILAGGLAILQFVR
jgi:drug/metabolite transporter (DMT)-like permease